MKKEMKFKQDADTRLVSVTVTKGEHESSFVCDTTEGTVVLSHLTHHSHRQCSVVLSVASPRGSTERIQNINS